MKIYLPPAFDPSPNVREVKGKDGIACLEMATGMWTYYWQTMGEHSRFFMAVQHGRLIGCACVKCGRTHVPPWSWHCPACGFAEMTEVKLPHEGVLAHTAAITVFPNTSFIGRAPFARGYVDVALNAPSRSFMPANLRTLTGLPRPGIFVKGTKLKLVFEEEREGKMTDLFFVPMEEVPKSLRGREPLLATDLDFETPIAPEIEQDADSVPILAEALVHVERLASNIRRSPRAQKDLTGKEFSVSVVTPAGAFSLELSGGTLRILRGKTGGQEIRTKHPAVFSSWAQGGSLTDAAIEGSLWLAGKETFELLPFLDRLPRSVRRDLQESAEGEAG